MHWFGGADAAGAVRNKIKRGLATRSRRSSVDRVCRYGLRDQETFDTSFPDRVAQAMWVEYAAMGCAIKRL